MKEEIEGTKGVIPKSKGRQPNNQEKKCTTRKTTIYKKKYTEN
jgi:hypothetical protein